MLFVAWESLPKQFVTFLLIGEFSEEPKKILQSVVVHKISNEYVQPKLSEVERRQLKHNKLHSICMQTVKNDLTDEEYSLKFLNLNPNITLGEFLCYLKISAPQDFKFTKHSIYDYEITLKRR